jgi:hypothetical protein
MRHRRYRQPASDVFEENVKRLIAFLSLLAMGSLAACDAVGDGTRESCVGPYTGTFEVESRDEGPLEGRILAYFGQPNSQTPMPELELSLTFDTETEIVIPDTRVLTDVTETGDVANRGGNFEFVGTFNLDDCEASGTWSGAPIFTNGTWRLSIGHSAY